MLFNKVFNNNNNNKNNNNSDSLMCIVQSEKVSIHIIARNTYVIAIDNHISVYLIFKIICLFLQSICSLLKRDIGLSFKSKGNPLVSVLACNLLMTAFAEEDNWPEDFVKVC